MSKSGRASGAGKGLTLYLAGVLLLFSAGCAKAVSNAPPVSAALPKEITGKDWLGLERRYREPYVAAAMNIVSGRGANLNKSSEEYDEQIDQWLRRHVDQADRNVSVILGAIVYDTEPNNRSVLDHFIRQPEISPENK